MTPAQEVFKYWQLIFAKSRSKYAGDKAKHINARLKDGYTVEELKQCLDGVLLSDWHMKRGAFRVRSGPKYITIPNVFSNTTKVDEHLERAVAKQEAVVVRAKPKEQSVNSTAPPKELNELTGKWLREINRRLRRKTAGKSS